MDEELQYGYSPVLPIDLVSSLQKYKQSPDSLSARNAAFQAFYSVNPKAAGQMVGSPNAKGYEGLLNGINAAYGITPTQQALIERAYEQAKLQQEISNDDFAPNTSQQNTGGRTVIQKKENVGLLPGLLDSTSQSTLRVLRR